MLLCLNEKKATDLARLVGEIKVSIVGAGITALYAALLLNHLEINYEILEDSNRIGYLDTYRI
ncbi:hypothetical protein B4U80_14754, partial [Leptotrombidium deliense]